MRRKSISKKVRFEVFKRDLFTCQYCGSTPPSVVLEVDHINPVSKGGDNSEDNLITACFDCNRGKGATKLTESIDAITKKLEVQKEKQEQLKCYEKMLSRKKALITRRVNELEAFFSESTDMIFSDSFKLSSRRFFEQLPKSDVFYAMELSLSRGLSPDRAVKYFCGVCWNKIKGKNNG